MSFSPHGHGLSCYFCDNCDCRFGIDCFDVTEDTSCPRCGSEDITRTNERAIRIVREWDSVEEYEEETK